MAAVSRVVLPTQLSRFCGAMAGALLGDCIGGEFEGKEVVRMHDVIEAVRALEEERQEEGSLIYSDDTAMTRCVAQSLISKTDFDEVDMAKRFAEEYNEQPDRGYGSGVILVFKKLLRPNCKDVFKPAREQFKGKGSYGNGGAMRIVPISLAYPDVQDVIKFAKKNAQVTHASSLGYNGAILQALAVHHALRGELKEDLYLDHLIGEMQLIENDEKSLSDARDFHEFPYCIRLKKMKTFLSRTDVSKEEVINELVLVLERSGIIPSFRATILKKEDIPPPPPSHTHAHTLHLRGATD
ncbi:ADP-ribosylhydrolase ARH3 isoform X3 [Narcine bancroftii]|uniref:ADP-ribosylhydrolase ARH3 isoform X3 n=1 Tax=Narcine bancroftii TaxID=1343680 RepID=UPI003832087D